MRLLQIISTLDPQSGGPSESIRQFCSQAVSLGHELEIVTLDAPDAAWLTQGVDTRVKVTALGPTSPGYGYNSRLVPWLAENAERFDAAIVRGLWQYHGYAARKAFLGTGTPYFVFTHGMLDPWFNRAYPLKHLKKLVYWFAAQRSVLADARGVLFTTEEEKLLARKSFPLYRCNEIVVSYGTRAPDVDLQAARQSFFSAHSQLRDKRLILFLGRIHPKKGVDMLIRAFAASHNVADLQLVLAGPDQVQVKSQLESLAKQLGVQDRVTWTGMLSGAVKWGAFAAAEVFALPSHQENFGIAVAEALACGTPVLVSNKVNIWREIQTDQSGFVADDTDAGTKQLLEKWLSLSEAERAVMRANAAKSFAGRFTIECAAASLLEAVQANLRAR